MRNSYFSENLFFGFGFTARQNYFTHLEPDSLFHLFIYLFIKDELVPSRCQRVYIR